jgi:hypothetical protein
MVTPSPQPSIITAGSIVSFPEAIQLTGTITSTGLEVIGIGTLFLTEIANPNLTSWLYYKYLFNSATGEIMEIEGVRSDTHLKLKAAFASDVSGADLWVVNNYFLSDISISPLGAGVVMYTVDSEGTTLDADTTVSINDKWGTLPVGLDCTAAGAQVITN